MPASVLTQSAGLRVGAGGGGHRAELGSAWVTGVLTAGSRLRSENRADGNALPPSVPPPPSLEWKATGTALSFEQEQMLYPHFTAERRERLFTDPCEGPRACRGGAARSQPQGL